MLAMKQNLDPLRDLKKQLTESLGIDVSVSVSASVQDVDADKHYANAIKLVYHSSAAQVLKVAQRLFKGYPFNGEMPERIDEVTLPKDEERNFQLGDWVEITVSKRDFKTIQRATLGWNTRLVTVHGHVGIITGMKSKHSNAIDLYFPKVLSGCTLHAGILRKVNRKDHENYQTPWKAGDIVKTISDSKILLLLQRGLAFIPSKFQGKKGRVTSVSQGSVEVTFDDTACHHVNPAALVLHEDKTPLERKTVEHARGFEIGDQVRVITNMKRLIENQKIPECEWEPDMSMLRGKQVTIIDILQDGTVYVQLPGKGSWRVNPDTVLSPRDDDDDPLYTEELGFVTEDIVKVKRSNDLRTILTSSEIPFSFLEYLRSPAKIATMDKDFNCYLLFNGEQHIQASPKALRKATKEEERKYREIQSKVDELKPGDTVHLDVGPPNYVRAVLQHVKLEPFILKALTKSATLKGFCDQHYAVIEYENGDKFKIKRKYLTVPDKFNITDSREGVDLNTVQEIQKVLQKSLAILKIEKDLGSEDSSVDVLTTSYGMPPTVEFKVASLLVKPKDVYVWLQQHSGWTIEHIGEGQLLIEGIKGFEGQMKVGIYFNDDAASILPSVDLGSSVTETNEQGGVAQGVTEQSPGEGSSVTETYEEGSAAEGGAQPFCNGNTSQRGVDVDPGPVLNKFEQFKLLRFSDPNLAQDVYFPYIVHGPRRTPIQSVQVAPPAPGTVIYNIANVDQISN